ncbi:LysR family transcriptional regulator [Verticiella sediminum]|uniref:LysR family transcriptional regulator n=1 Tax=Verticiella sediminum TaxID=1247510 RepID=A0A556AIP1_9BURK|nr:LysR substrate-binding domain-containing protein [Verticiella sediminum]TSH92747.1 LysR family transcriptional regulator [Verticiella sediminum]
MSSVPRFDLTDIRVFTSVAEEESFTRGAERAFLSLSAASLRVKNLEEVLGAQLFYRGTRGLSLTPAGEAFLECARNVLHGVERLQDIMQPFSQGVSGHVRLFANATAISEILPGVLARFFRTHAGITVDLQERLSAEIVRAVHERIADIGVISGHVVAEGVETLPYRKDRLVLAVAEDHPLADVPFMYFADALEHDFIGLDTHSATVAFLQHEVAQMRCSLRQRVQVCSFDAMCRMVEAGVGVGVLPEMVAKRLAKATRFKTVQLMDDWAMRELRICVRRQSEMPVFARELVDFILQSG